MKMFTIAAALVVASASIASAQPAMTAYPAPLIQTEPEPTGYVQVGVEVGGDEGGLYGAYTLEGGVRVSTTPFWIHGLAGFGGISGGLFTATDSSAFLDVRGGLELRSCSRAAAACFIAGVDLGYRYDQRTGHDDLLFTGGSTATNVDDAEFEVVPHVSGDFGGRHVRVRPGLQLPITPVQLGLGLQLGVAYVW